VLGLGKANVAADVDSGRLNGHGEILKFRFPLEGPFTVNGKALEPGELSDPIRSAASSGGAAWIWCEGGAATDSSKFDEVMRELTRVNLRLAFASNEDFSGIPLPEQGDAVRPSNAFIYSSDEEVRRYVGNETELFVYFSSLQLCFDSYFADRDDSGVFHIVGALRPDVSKMWLVRQGVQNEGNYQPLLDALEGHPVPTVKEGVLAFLISIKLPYVPGESPQFEVVAPDEWTDVPKRLGKEMSVSEILNVVWPAESGR